MLLLLVLALNCCAAVNPVSTYHLDKFKVICLPALYRGHFITLCCQYRTGRCFPED
jgi:hypothetical protein